MSRMGKKVISVPSDVAVSLENSFIKVVGKMGSSKVSFDKDVFDISIDSNFVKVLPQSKSKSVYPMWGTIASLLKNAINGVSKGFTINIDLVGVGYKAQKTNNDLQLSLGYSHPIVCEIPQGVTAELPKPNRIVLHSFDKKAVGDFADRLRSFRPVEPYKGKGVILEGQFVERKEGKKK